MQVIQSKNIKIDSCQRRLHKRYSLFWLVFSFFLNELVFHTAGDVYLDSLSLPNCASAALPPSDSKPALA